MTRLRMQFAAGWATLVVFASCNAFADDNKCLRIIGTDWASEQQSVDPLINNNVADLMRLTTIYEKLVELDNGYQPVPVLAKSWEPTSDGTVCTFHPRNAFKFSH